MSDKKQVELMKGVTSSDNCYMQSHAKESLNKLCFISKFEETKLWLQQLGHINLRSRKKIIYEKANVGIPELKIVKQVKTSHKMVHHLTTYSVLEFLNKDLMGPMQVENL